MALDFPSSPADGAVYGNYTYNTAKGAWIVTPTSSRVATTSDTPPASPSNGDMWMYTVDGTCFIYYEDGTSGQWVEQSRNTISASTYQSPNFLINGGFNIWQRGTSSTTSDAYIVDRWRQFWNAGTATVSRSTDVPVSTLQYSVSYASTSGTSPALFQRIEAANALQLVGQTVTFSIWAKSTVGTGGLSWTSFFPTTTADTFSAVTTDQSGVFAATMTVGTWTRYSATFTVAAGAIRGYGVNVFRNVTTTSTTTLYAGAQLELGSVATSFRRNAPNIQAELAACQRYYANMTTGETGVGLFAGFAYATTASVITLQLPVAMRATPVLVLSSASHFSTSSTNGTGLTTTAITLGGTSTITSRLNISVASGYTAGQGTFLATASTSAVLAFNSEL